MEANHKKILKAISLELRHLLEGRYDSDGKWQPGDLEQRLAAIGVRRDREPVPVDELAHLSDDDKHARTVVDAYLQLRNEADVSREEAVAEFVRETAYTWANRLFCLRCMEARELIDEVILQKEAYGGRSLEHHRLAQRDPEVCSGEDDGLFAMLEKVFSDQAEHLPLLFDPQSPGVALKPSPAVLKRCLALLSGTEAVRSQDPATGEVFKAPDALGWAYQYWNTEEKDRVFEKVRTQKGTKIAGADIIPATQLYTEPYMVKFLVQNSLGATWMGMYPDSKLYEKWEYYVRDADRAPAEMKRVAEITFLDPACGSGHFLIEAFDLYYEMYVEEGELTEPEDICRSILERNVFGIDIDARAVQIAEVALWMKAAERAFNFQGAATNLVAAVASHLKGDLWEEFLAGFEREPSVARVLRNFGQAMEHIDELGSLARPEEELRAIIHEEHAMWERQVREQEEANFLFPELVEDALSGQLPFHEVSDEEFGERLLYRAKVAIDGFTAKANEEGTFHGQFLAHETSEGFRLLELLSRKYDVLAANPPYMGTTQLSPAVARAVAQHANSPDLYCALMLRWLDLQARPGIAALVTRADYLTQSECQELRQELLANTSLRVLVRLENRVFRDLSNPNAIFFSMQVHTVPKSPSSVITHLAVSDSDYELKAKELAQKLDGCCLLGRIGQHAFEKLPRNTFALHLPAWGYDAYATQPLFSEFAVARQGLITGDTARFLRYRWETPFGGKRWSVYAKGGEFRRWFGNDYWSVDWEHDGARLRNFVNPATGKKRSRVQNTAFYGRRGVTWSSQTVSAFATRILEPGSIFDTTGSSAFLQDDCDSESNLMQIMGVLNSPGFGVLFRSMQPGVHFGEGYLEKLPCSRPDDLPESLADLVSDCIAIQREVSGFDRCSSVFMPPRRFLAGTYVDTLRDVVVARLKLESQVYCKELSVWDLGEHALGIPEGERSSRVRTDSESKTSASTFLDQLWKSSPSPTAELWVATQSRVEDACVRTKTAPDKATALVENLSVECLPKSILQHAAAWVIEPIILRLLGHRWPKQIAAGETVPEWADLDGIIPLTQGTDEATVLERIRKRIAAEFEGGDVASIEREFAQIMGKPLDKWLTMEFFKHHTKQFKRRPIAWQIQSGKFTARKIPAFACLIYYHKFDGDLLPKIRNQYVGPLRSRLETELRSIESVSSDTRSDRQEGRRSELQDEIDELRDFDAALQHVITGGFASKELTKILKDEPLDKWCSLDGTRPEPENQEDLLQQESGYFPDINDGVRVNIAPLQKAGLLAAPVLSKKDLDKAIADRAQWRADERRWCRENKLPQPGWWPEQEG